MNNEQLAAHLKSHRFVRMFKPQFALMVRSGQKRQTVRPTPKRMPAPGDIIDARQWSARPYNSHQVKLIEATVTTVTRILIHDTGILHDGHPLLGDELWKFAKADGFNTPQDMLDWFAFEHGLPFSGILIQWQP